MTLPLLRTLTIAVAGALLALMLYAGEPGRLSWWTLALPFALWIVGPAVLPYVLARRLAAMRGAVPVMTGFLIVSSALSALAYHHAFFVSRSSTAGLAMVFVPLYQWAALGVLAFGWLIARRRARRR